MTTSTNQASYLSSEEVITGRSLPTDAQQTEYFAKRTAAAVGARTFTYTDAFCAREPVTSKAFQWLDGVVVENGTPKYGVNPAEDWGGRGILLLHKEPNGVFRVQLPSVKVRIPGTEIYEEQERFKEYKSFAEVQDDPRMNGGRTARQVLFTRGWPTILVASKGARQDGDVIEFRYLKREASRADADQYVRDLYAEVLTRPGLKELAMDLGELAPEPAVAVGKAAKGAL